MYQSAQEFIDIISTKKKSNKERPDDYPLLLNRLGHPEQQLRCLHVAGTNGKGSVTNYLRSILQSSGYQVGSFTSPHLIVHNDRIRINDQYISDAQLLDLANRYAWCWEEYDLSMFEIDMILSIFYFLEQKVDYVVYEVGLGGRLDPTNIITPLASIIVNIGYDHMELLGDTLEKIAYEKAGIIKEQVPVFTAEEKPECLAVFQQVAEQHHTRVYRTHAVESKRVKETLSFSYDTYDITLNTIAGYQVQNASLALYCADWLNRHQIINIPKEAIRNGLQNTFWKGRFEVMKDHPLVIVDGAHNQHGVSAILDSVKQLPHPRAIVVSILKDKQYHEMLKLLQPLADELILTEFVNSRIAHVQQLSVDVDATIIPDWQAAIIYTEEKYAQGSVLLTGSLYFVSQVRAWYKKEECV